MRMLVFLLLAILSVPFRFMFSVFPCVGFILLGPIWTILDVYYWAKGKPWEFSIGRVTAEMLREIWRF